MVTMEITMATAVNVDDEVILGESAALHRSRSNLQGKHRSLSIPRGNSVVHQTTHTV